MTATVPQPARGLSTRQTYLHFPIQNVLVTNATSGVVTSNTWPTAIEFNAGSLANSVTVLMRLRADTFNAFLGNGEYSWVVNNGEHWGTAFWLQSEQDHRRTLGAALHDVWEADFHLVALGRNERLV